VSLEYKHHCCMYAAAAHLVTGYPIYFMGGGHAVLKTPQGWLDETGLCDLAAVATYWGIETYLDEAGDYGQEHMVESYKEVPTWDELVQEAREQKARLGL
jgi:hypothetical protein